MFETLVRPLGKVGADQRGQELGKSWGEMVDDLLESRHSWTLGEVHGLVSMGSLVRQPPPADCKPRPPGCDWV